MEEIKEIEEIDYFVSFSYVREDGIRGFGNAGFRRSVPIRTGEHIAEIQNDILKTDENYKSIIILNWKRFED